MRHHSSARQQQIEAEYQARREQAHRDFEDARAQRLVEAELGGEVIAVEKHGR